MIYLVRLILMSIMAYPGWVKTLDVILTSIVAFVVLLFIVLWYFLEVREEKAVRTREV